MNHQIPFLEELKEDLLEHAPQGTAHPPARPRLGLKGAWVAAAAFMVVLLAGGLSWILGGDPVPDTTVVEPVDHLGPELHWRQVEPPGAVDRVRNLWGLPGGFALWTGEEIWTSTTGDDWQLAASSPPITDTNHVEGVARIDDSWLVAGAGENNSPVIAASSDGSTWSTAVLPVPSTPNELLASRVEVVALASGPNGVVAVGALTTGVDEQAVIARFAPELTGVEVRYQDDGILIVPSDGSDGVTVAFEDIDERLAGQRVLLDTILWHSPDGRSWSEVDFIEDFGPLFLEANASGYVLPLISFNPPANLIFTSDNGIDWDVLTELREPVDTYALDEHGLIVGGDDVTLFRVQPDGAIQPVSSGPAFNDTDLQDETTLQDLTVGQMAAGPYGIIAAAFDHTRASTPYEALWYSPDGQRWSRQNTNEVFGGEANLQVAVGNDRVVVATDPNGQAGLALESPLQMWIGTTEK